MQTFADFGLCGPIEAALAAEGYQTPTPIQQQAIAPILAGRDLCGIAQTGTGKTAAFALPILHRFATEKAARKPRAPRALVLTPTRELASQIAESFRSFSTRLDLRTAVIFGGVSQGRQTQELQRGVDILVATPGRLLDLIDQRLLTLSNVEVLVVDEADQMLDLGFIVPLRKIVKLVPAERQTLFFSATMPTSISQLAGALLTDPVQVAVRPVATTAERVEQSVIFIATGQKQALLDRLVADPAMERVLVFTRTKHGADKVVRNLARTGVKAQAIHGNKSQAQRERALAEFKSGGTRILVATDIAARGIHVESVSHVVNYDLPNVAESYVHRIGRTARAGAAGIAISFCNGEERAYLRDIEKLTRSSIPVVQAPHGLVALAPEPAEPTRAGRPGNRPQQTRGRGKPARSSRENQQRHSGNQQRPRFEHGKASAVRQASAPAQPRPAQRTAGAIEGGDAIGWLRRGEAQAPAR